jgi:hypothetical protein
MFSVQIDTRQLKQAIAQLKEKAPLACARALNKTAASANTQARRTIAKDMKTKQADIQKKLKVVKARRTDLEATLGASGDRIPLVYWARDNRVMRGTNLINHLVSLITYGQGVVYDLGQGKKSLPHAFITTVRSRRQAELGYAGHKGVFRRVGKGRKLSKEFYGPSIPHVFTAETILPAMLASAKANLEKYMKHEVEYLLSKRP